MASQASFVEFILDQLSACDDVIAKKMFGEYALYMSGKMFALICDDQLFIKPTTAGRELLGTTTEVPPYPQARPWYLIDSDLLENRDDLAALARATAAALPMPVKKAKKTAKTSSA
ncbi:TfoX/Sxy family protein [Undibacterium sp. CY18W]|uniref:TfoX/Sxy family protein n=1 Tax=Undibacterium hunanense TaxID=2762292 RepID=A0ABR6ZTV7_9BURK|nr:TfoX/Sxy family protein [Undibacterium hunanense]MBC3919332.1 TfoX/Sxy family protein [Undibacterium hunanense]